MRPCSRQADASASTACSSPETTVAIGPFTAATETRSRSGASSATTSASVARTATIAPPVGSCCIRRPRAATSTAASDSDRTPATCAAASSPTEWPSSRSGTTPQCSKSRYSATSRANRAGWANSVRWTSSACGLPSGANSTSRSGRASCGSRCRQTASNASANTANRPYTSRPMPGRWLPCPANRAAVRPERTSPTTTPGAAPVWARASSPARSSPRSPASTTAR